jgi:DNA polymerase III epsilon subunit family exonuclease
MAQLQLFDTPLADKAASLSEENAMGRRYRRFVFHGEIEESRARQMLGTFLKQLRKHDANATAQLEDLMSNGPWVDMPFLCVDTETTGLDRNNNRVIEIAWVLFAGQKELFAASHLCSHEGELPAEIVNLTGITSEMVKDQPPFGAHVPDFFEALSKAAFVVAYNANFDRLFIEAELGRVGLKLPKKHWVDPCVFVREIDRYQKGKRLTDATKRWGVELTDAHRALFDAKATGLLLYKLAPHLKAFSLPELILLQQKWQEEQEQAHRAYMARKQAF